MARSGKFPGQLWTRLQPPFATASRALVCVMVLVCALSSSNRVTASPASEDIPDVTGKYEFLSEEDTLAILEEEGKLKGYIDVLQSEEESDAVLSYPITAGTRRRNSIEFKTSKIHQRYYRFAGTVRRGAGHEETDPDYLRLIGDLEIVTKKGETGKESLQRQRVILKSLGRRERKEDQ